MMREPVPQRPRWRGVVLVAIGLLLYNSTVQLIPNYTAWYVPVNAIATGFMGIAAWRLGLAAADLGLERNTIRAGLGWGGMVAAGTAVILLCAVAIPVFHPLFEDERLADVGTGIVAYRALVRIPFGTALFEEFAFRGVLLGAWERVSDQARAMLGSSLVFGLWHIRPTIELLEVNGLAETSLGRAGALLVAIAATAVAGYLFCLLRRRSGSLIAPFVAHTAINSLAIIAAAVVIA